MNEPSKALQTVVAALDQCDAQWLLTGSMAAAVWAPVEPALDFDLLATLAPERRDEFARGLGDEFSPAVNGDGVSAFHWPSRCRFGIIPAMHHPFNACQLERRRTVRIDGLELHVATAEDLILSTLLYRSASSVPPEIAATQRTRLDLDYLRLWAAHLGVTDLLDRLLSSQSGRRACESSGGRTPLLPGCA